MWRMWGLLRAEGRLVRGGPLTSDRGAFCKGNRETQVNVTGEGAEGPGVTPVPLPGSGAAVSLMRAGAGGLWGRRFLQAASLGLGEVPGRLRLLPRVTLGFQQGVALKSK